MKKSAFTLSEVLITISIVGVIAVLTLPQIIRDFTAKTQVATLKSTYQQVGDAISQAMVDQGVRHILDLDFDGDTNAKKLSSFAFRYLDVIKDCGSERATCFPGSYKSVKGEDIEEPFSNGGYGYEEYVMLKNGAALAFSMILGDNYDDDLYLFVDVNGTERPNVFGKDAFVIFVRKDGGLGWYPVQSAALDDMKESCEEHHDASVAENCFELLKAKDWDIEHYLN